MNKGITLLNVFMASFLLFVAVSCKKVEQEILPSNSTDEFSLQEAKQWFDANKTTLAANSIKQGRISAVNQVKKEPLWKAAINHHFTKSYVVEIPLHYEQQTGLVMHAKNKTPDDNYSKEQSKKLSTLTKMLIGKDEKGQFKLSIMKLIGEEAYLKRHNYNPSNNTFGKKESDFSGMMMYYNWNEDFITGYQY